MKAQPTKQITLAARSFNMERLKVVQMFGQPLPKRLVMPITFMAITNRLPDAMVMEFLRARQIMQAVFAAGHLDPAKFGITSKIEPIIVLDMNPVHFIQCRLPRVWLYQGFYLQASYFNLKKVTSAVPYHATSTAQTLFDIMYDQTGSLDPAQHQPIQQSFRQVQELNLTISGFYAAEIGVWSKYLLEYHIAALTMLRAAWMGRNPVQEYPRSINAGVKYFFDYPALCP